MQSVFRSKNPFRFWVVFILLVILVGCEPDSLSLTVQNPHDEAWSDAPVTLNLREFGLVDGGLVRVYRNGNGAWTEVPSQRDGEDLFFMLNLDPFETVDVEVRRSEDSVSYSSRATAFLAVRQGGRVENGAYVGGGAFVPVHATEVPAGLQIDTSWAWFAGPVWESDRIGYRSYLEPRRNLVDVFGKLVPEPALLHAQGDPHYLQDWGTDVLLVGNSLSLGTPAVVTDSGYSRFEGAEMRRVEIVASGPLRAIVRTTYGNVPLGGQVLDVVSEQEIHAGDRWTEQRLFLTGLVDTLELATGIVRHPEVPALITGSEAGVFFLYTWGPQSAQGDPLGLAVLIPEILEPEVHPDDPVNHLVSFKPQGTSVAYRYLAVWGLEPGGITTERDFHEAVRRAARHWMQPVEIEPAGD